MHYAHLLELFSYCRPSVRANSWHVRCPCTGNHKNGDKRPSAMVWIGTDGDLRFWCAKGCKWKEAVAATGTKPTDWFPEKDDRPRMRKPMPRVIATYDYTDEFGQLIYQVCRTDPKGFRQRRPVPNRPGQWAHTLSGGKFYFDRQQDCWREKLNAQGPGEVIELEDVRKVPYHLPELIGSGSDIICVTEGEGKADLLRQLGFRSTCASGGAGRWPFSFGRYFHLKNVVVFPDNDLVGLQHAYLVAASCLAGGALSIRVVREGLGWEDLPERGDIKDWLEERSKVVGDSIEDMAKSVLDLATRQTEWLRR